MKVMCGMRVISGTAKGRKLLAPIGDNTRPTTDRIKETLFNIIAPLISGSKFLDIFSGSGAIGIEALSRGADFACFIENEKNAVKLIKNNLTNTNLSEKSRVLNLDFRTALNNLGSLDEKFNIIFLDPPYFADFANDALSLIVNNQLLARDGSVIVEQSSKESLPNTRGLEIYRQRDFGTTTMLFLSGE